MDFLCYYIAGIVSGLFIAAAIGCWLERRKKPAQFHLIPLNDVLWRKDFDHPESILNAEHQARKERLQ